MTAEIKPRHREQAKAWIASPSPIPMELAECTEYFEMWKRRKAGRGVVDSHTSRMDDVLEAYAMAIADTEARMAKHLTEYADQLSPIGDSFEARAMVEGAILALAGRADAILSGEYLDEMSSPPPGQHHKSSEVTS